jgi:predicted dehydrogenase
MKRKVLVVGYGSMGKRHVRNLSSMRIVTYVLTDHPDKMSNVKFLDDLVLLKNENVEYCIISSQTSKHLEDLKRCTSSLINLKKVLIEKPLESSYLKGLEIKNIAKKYNLEIFLGYNLRFINAFSFIKKFIRRYRKNIRIVEATAGQDLRQWRTSRDVSRYYSASRSLGGGVDLDLSHEIDYILWLFGCKFKKKIIYRTKISNLNIDSPDFLKFFLDFDKFIVDITLDYIRIPRERYLKIICDSGQNLYYNFFSGTLKINGRVILSRGDLKQSYIKMLLAFLGINKDDKVKLCTLDEGLNILKILEA